MLGGTYTRDLADTRKKRLGIVALAEDMSGLFGFQLVRKLAHLLEVPAVFLNFSGELPAECCGCAALFFNPGLEPFCVVT